MAPKFPVKIIFSCSVGGGGGGGGGKFSVRKRKEHKLKLLGPVLFRWGASSVSRGGGQKVRYVP